MAERVNRNPGRERRWREIIRRHAASGMTVRVFCRQSRLKESAFHRWRAELRRRDASDRPAGSMFVPVVVSDRTAQQARSDLRLPFHFCGCRGVNGPGYHEDCLDEFWTDNCPARQIKNTNKKPIVLGLAPDSACPTRQIGYDNDESHAGPKGTTPSGILISGVWLQGDRADMDATDLHQPLDRPRRTERHRWQWANTCNATRDWQDHKC